VRIGERSIWLSPKQAEAVEYEGLVASASAPAGAELRSEPARSGRAGDDIDPCPAEWQPIASLRDSPRQGDGAQANASE